MTTELTLLGAKNRTTQEYFVFIEACERNQVKLINRAGQMLTVPQHIFESPVAIHASQFGSCFTNAQLVAVDQVKKSGGQKTSSSKKAAPRKATKTAPAKTGLGATWSAPNLTFFKYRIDPLSPKQSFRIELESGEVFEITKEEFQSVFADLMLSHEYAQGGSYSFPEFPTRARKYLKG